MGLADLFRRPLTEANGADVDVLSEQLRAEQESNLMLHESMADLALALEDRGWQQITLDSDRELSRSGIQKMAALCRVMAAVNPLIGRGLRIRCSYVFGQGVQIAARAAESDDTGQDVNAVVQAFLDDPKTQSALLSAQAREERERACGTDGNQFIACDTDPLTGQVRPRIIPPEQIQDLICNPEDVRETWFVKRTWTTPLINLDSGQAESITRTVFHPVLGYRPGAGARRSAIGGSQVMWDQPVLHAAVNRPEGSRWGIPDAYAAIAWARAYKAFLEDWATLVKALSRLAWRATAPGSKAAQMRQRLAQAPSRDPLTGNSNDVGGIALMQPGTTLEAIPKAGATIDSESGKPLAAMVAAALDVPVTMLLGDPGTTGARAVAETLDRPMQLAFESRRALWADWLGAIIDHVIDAAVRAPRGPLKGTIRAEADREVVDLAEDTKRTVDITWPSLDDVDPATVVKSIVEADSTGKLPPLIVVRLLLEALGVGDIDEILNELTDDQGNFIDPDVGAGAAAVAAFRQGRDAAEALR